MSDPAGKYAAPPSLSSGESSRRTSWMNPMGLFCATVNSPAKGFQLVLSRNVLDWWALMVWTPTLA